MSLVLSEAPIAAGGYEGGSSGMVLAVHQILSLPDDQLDYAAAKLALDKLIDPSIDVISLAAELDRMAALARDLAGPSPSADTMFGALRRLIYESGPWNDHRPFSYDHSDSKGENIQNKLISTYLTTHRGNCISMPIFFLILAEKLGLDMALAIAPLHMLLRYKLEGGPVINLETTSGANPTRLEWFQRNMPMSDLALKNGIYMRSLTPREAMAAMAAIIVEHLLDERRYEEAAEVCRIILKYNPLDCHTMVKEGTAYGYILQQQFEEKYPNVTLIPSVLRSRYLLLCQRNMAAFGRAEALGWEPGE